MSRRSPYTMKRCHLNPFTTWLRGLGWHKVPTKGPYEHARYNHPGKRMPIILFRKRYDNHTLTVQEKDITLVSEFLQCVRTQWKRRQPRQSVMQRVPIVDSPYKEDYPTTE